MENQDKDKFSYTYSAKEQEAIRNIRKKYAPPEENKMEYLCRLDAGVYQKAVRYSMIAGVIGALMLGVGLCCAMVWQGLWFLPGVFIGLAGMAIVAAAHPVYQKVVKKEREKIAPEILRLTDELMQ